MARRTQQTDGAPVRTARPRARGAPGAPGAGTPVSEIVAGPPGTAAERPGGGERADGALVFRLRERAGDEWAWDVLTVDAGGLRPAEGGFEFRGPLDQYARLVYGLASTCTVTAATEALYRELVDAIARLREGQRAATGPARRRFEASLRRLRLVPPGALPAPWRQTVADRLPYVPGPFRDGFAPVPANHVTFALNQAIQHAAGALEWSDHDGRTAPTHLTRTNKGKGAVYVSVRGPDGATTPAPEALPALWAQVRAMSDTTSDALLVCLAMAERHGAGPSASVWVTADAILDARGIKRIRRPGEPGNWQHGHRREDRLEAGRALAQLQNLWLRVESVQVTSARRGATPRTLTLDSRALAILDKLGQQELDGGQVFLAARVAFGEWAAHYWEAGLRQVALLTQKALGYDPYRQQTEKRLAKYLCFHFRFDGAGDGGEEGEDGERGDGDGGDPRALHRTVETLLTEADLTPSDHDPQRARDRLEKALARLSADGVIGAWRYRDDPAALPARQWVPAWRRMSIAITPPHLPARPRPLGAGRPRPALAPPLVARRGRR
jgi:hypothetical protein